MVAHACFQVDEIPIKDIHLPLAGALLISLAISYG